MKTLLRFIARLHCTWWLPYRSLVKRLIEITVINDSQYKELYGIDGRKMDGEYSKMGLAVKSEVFSKLNTVTKNTSTSPKNIEIIVRNFEGSLIDEDRFADTLSLFGKNPNDFGYDYAVSEGNLAQFEAFFNEASH